MEESLFNSEKYLEWKMINASDRENDQNKSPVEGNPRVPSNIDVPGNVSTHSDGDGECCPDQSRSSSPVSEDFDYGSFLENGCSSPMTGDFSSDESCPEADHTTRSGQSSEDDGGDFTVSRYMQSKISRLDEAKFGVWRVERVDATAGVERPSGTWEIAGSSLSTGVPPLKLTLKKSLQETSGEQPPKERVKKKHKTKREPKDSTEPKDPQKRRGPGRPPTNNPPSLSTRQRLMNMFKKKYFKDRKRWARSKFPCSMPPTIRSIAKP